MMSAESEPILIVVVAAITAALGSLAAAIAAWRSAQSAQNTIQNAKDSEIRRLRLGIAQIGQRIIAETVSVNRLCDETKLLYDSLAVFTGGIGGSRQKLYADRLEEQRDEVASIGIQYESQANDEKLTHSMSIDDIDELLISFTMKLEQVSGIRRLIEDEKQDINHQVRMFQAKAINSMHT